MKFRKLRAEEVDIRIGSTKNLAKGITLLLFKDARCDMNILDETVGCFKWGRDHKELKGNIYCGVSITDDDGNKVTKWDAGSESFTEAVKGEASDSFKRACVNWGIGRELYTAGLIWIKTGDFNVTGGKVYDRFEVVTIGYDDSGNINKLEIKNTKTGKNVFKRSSGKKKQLEPQSKAVAKEQVDPSIRKKEMTNKFKKLIEEYGQPDVVYVWKSISNSKSEDATDEEINKLKVMLEAKEARESNE